MAREDICKMARELSRDVHVAELKETAQVPPYQHIFIITRRYKGSSYGSKKAIFSAF